MNADQIDPNSKLKPRSKLLLEQRFIYMVAQDYLAGRYNNNL